MPDKEPTEETASYYNEAPDLGPLPPDPFTKHHVAFVVIPPDKTLIIWAFAIGYMVGAILWGLDKKGQHDGP